MTGVEVPDEIPPNEYSIYFAPENRIHMKTSNMENQNSNSYLTKTTEQILKNLSCVNSPGVQLNINGNQPFKVNMTEVIRERRDLW